MQRTIHIALALAAVLLPAGLIGAQPQDFDTLAAAGNGSPRGIWSDGTTMWVANYDGDNEYNVKIYAYNLATKRPIP